MRTSTQEDDQHQNAFPWRPGGTDLITSDGFKQMRLNSKPSLKWEIMTKTRWAECSWLSREAAAVASFNVLKNGRGGAMRQRPAAIHNRWYVAQRELEGVWGMRMCTYYRTPAAQASGILTLAFSANCYSFTLAQFPRALNLQSLRVRCLYYISGCAWAHHTSFEWQPVYWRQHTYINNICCMFCALINMIFFIYIFILRLCTACLNISIIFYLLFFPHCSPCLCRILITLRF